MLSISLPRTLLSSFYTFLYLQPYPARLIPSSPHLSAPVTLFSPLSNSLTGESSIADGNRLAKSIIESNRLASWLKLGLPKSERRKKGGREVGEVLCELLRSNYFFESSTKFILLSAGKNLAAV